MGKNKNKNRGGGNAAAKTKNTETAKAVAGLLLVVLLAVAYVITSLALGYASHAGAPVWNPLHWGKVNTADNGNSNTTRTIAVSSDGSEIKDGGAYALGCNAVSGITYLSEIRNNQTYVPDGEIYVTAELSNEYINGAFDWSVEFVNPSAEWAVGKVATYYVSAEPVAGDSSRAKLRYFAPFGEQIILTATLRGTDSSDSCTIDCLKPVTSYQVDHCYIDFDDPSSFGINKIVFGIGTITGNFEFVSGRYALDQNFISDMQSYLKFDLAINVAGFSAADVTWCSSDGKADCGILEYSMFIENFDNYDEAHKQAIYYAWYTAFKPYRNSANANALIDCVFNYAYNGVTIAVIYGNDEPLCQITGDVYGYEVAPNTTLNKNYVF